MAQTKTIPDLVNYTLRTALGIIDGTETPSADQVRDMKDVYDVAYHELADKGLAYWEEASIPSAIFDHLCRYCGSRIAPSFGLPRDIALENYTESEIRKHVFKSSSKLPIPGQYF